MVQAAVPIAVVTTTGKLGDNWSRDDVLDALDEQGASDERMLDLKREEAKIFAKQPPLDYFEEDYVGVLALEGNNRVAAMWMLAHLVEYAGLPEAHLLKAGLLLDMYCLRKPGVLLHTSIPVLCVALVKIIMKVEDSTPSENLLGLATHASNLVHRLQQGCDQAFQPLSSRELVDQEAAILDALEWNIIMPTVQEWTELTSTRLNIFMFGLLAPMLTPMWDVSSYLAKTLALNCTTTDGFLPSRVAQGLLCISLVAARVLPASIFKLEFSELACPYLDGRQDAKIAFKPESVEFVLQRLEMASGSDRNALREDALFVNETLLNIQCQKQGDKWSYDEGCNTH
jgi:hypothetical protein